MKQRCWILGSVGWFPAGIVGTGRTTTICRIQVPDGTQGAWHCSADVGLFRRLFLTDEDEGEDEDVVSGLHVSSKVRRKISRYVRPSSINSGDWLVHQNQCPKRLEEVMS